MRRVSVMCLISCVIGCLAAVPATAVARVAEPRTAAARTGVTVTSRSDFNGDGFGDLAIGLPHEDVTAVDDGAVEVLYGTSTGLSDAGAQLWTQDSPNVNETAEAGDFFGAAVASGDFNGDGFDDLAIGVPDESVFSQVQEGVVQVLFGSAGGLSASNNFIFFPPGSGDHSGDTFGASVTAGDFDADGFDDLAAGAPQHDTDGIDNAGIVDIRFGDALGFNTSREQTWSQDTQGVAGAARTGDLFGSSLAAGQMGHGRADDLAVGVKRDHVTASVDAGAVNVLYGKVGVGLSTGGNQLWNEDTGSVPGTAQSFDQFGFSLAIGDFDGDGIGELAIGAPTDTVGTATGAGVVIVLPGTASGLTDVASQLWSQDSPGIDGTAEAGDSFGIALASANFGNGTQDDLAIGIDGENTDGQENAGAVEVLYGSSTGLTATGSKLLSQSGDAVPGDPAGGDTFGAAVFAANFGSGRAADLAVGVPFEDVGTATNAGVVNVFYGGSAGLTSRNAQLWSQDTGNVPDSSEKDDNFGNALA